MLPVFARLAAHQSRRFRVPPVLVDRFVVTGTSLRTVGALRPLGHEHAWLSSGRSAAKPCFFGLILVVLDDYV